MDEFPKKGNNKQKAAWHDAFVERVRGASFAGDEPQKAALIRHHTSESQKYKRAYAKEVALHALKSQNADAHLAAAEAYRATGDHREQAHREFAKDPKKEGGYSPYASKRHEAAEAKRLGLTAPVAEKSEPRAATLARGILAAVELRKAIKEPQIVFEPTDSAESQAYHQGRWWFYTPDGMLRRAGQSPRDAVHVGDQEAAKRHILRVDPPRQEARSFKQRRVRGAPDLTGLVPK